MNKRLRHLLRGLDGLTGSQFLGDRNSHGEATTATWQRPTSGHGCNLMRFCRSRCYFASVYQNHPNILQNRPSLNSIYASRCRYRELPKVHFVHRFTKSESTYFGGEGSLSQVVLALPSYGPPGDSMRTSGATPRCSPCRSPRGACRQCR